MGVDEKNRDTGSTTLNTDGVELLDNSRIETIVVTIQVGFYQGDATGRKGFPLIAAVMASRIFLPCFLAVER